MPQATKPLFDFTTDAGRAGWVPAHDVASLKPSAEGLTITVSGNDPYLHSPLVSVPVGKPLWLRLKLKTNQSGMAQLFYFVPPAYATEEASVRFAVRAGKWEEVVVALPPLPAEKCHFRFDPPGTKGAVVTVASLALEPRVALTEPKWPETVPVPTASAFQVEAGGLRVRQTTGLGAFELLWEGAILATGYTRPQLGYQTKPDSPLKWVSVGERAVTTPLINGSELRAAFRDDDSGVWTWKQAFRPVAEGRIEVLTSLTCDQDRWLAHFPALALLVRDRAQAVLCGVEYLDPKDSSSSEADLTGPQAQRHVPEPHQVTIPLMALAHGNHWLAVAWEMSPQMAACFDSPNRRFGTEGHLVGLLWPGTLRPPGSLLPHGSVLVKADQPLSCKATVYAGRGESILPAVERWVKDNPLPPLPKLEVDPLKLAAVGFTQSGCPEGGLFRHALPGDFTPQPAADAAMLLELLKLRGPATQAKARLAPGDWGGVGHIRTLAPALAAKQGESLLSGAAARAQSAFGRIAADGTLPYKPGKVDYGKTHFETTANGMVAPVLYAGLEAAMLSGDKELIALGLSRLRQVHTRWKNTVPRGAQTWEVPLHTPDILASAHLVKALVLGFQLSGDPFFLDAAKHWAWAGVPFIYLVHPNPSEAVGLYGTTPVLGATGWIAPNWIGLPVQWCGLVYADALYDLLEHDPRGPWKRLADGICVSGVQQSFPPGSDPQRQGLLPDSFNVVAQLRNDPAINPATLLVPWLRSQGKPVYSRAALSPGVLVHAPGRIRSKDNKQATVEGWPESPYSILVTGLSAEPKQIRGNVKKVGYNSGVLILEAAGTATLGLG